MKFVVEIPCHEVAANSKEEVLGSLSAVISCINKMTEKEFWQYAFKVDPNSQEDYVSYGLVLEAVNEHE